jgi:hypothetical protein
MSTARTRLEKELEKSLQPLRRQNDSAVAVDLLRAFAQQVAKLIDTGGASVGVELGHLVNQGQEYRVVVRAPQIHLVDILLRAFIPIDGFPVVVDMFAQGETSCASEDDLVKALVDVSKQPAVRERLTNIRQALLDPELRDDDAGGHKNREPKAKKSSKKSSAA